MTLIECWAPETQIDVKFKSTTIIIYSPSLSRKKKERNKNEIESFHRSSPYRKEKCEEKKYKYINCIHKLIESY
jgi:hypothetical protein